MKLFSRMLTRKPTEEEAMGKIDLDMDGDGEGRPGEPIADDTGRINPTRVRSSRTNMDADDPFASVDGDAISARDEEPEEAEGAGWADNPFAADADWEDDTDWDEDDFATDDEVEEPQPVRATDAAGVVGSVGSKSEGKDWETDDIQGRRAIARSRSPDRPAGCGSALYWSSHRH